MPRIAWLAIGVVAAAWASLSVGLVVAAAGTAAAAAAALVVAASRWRRHVRPLALLALGATIVILRIAVGPRALTTTGVPPGDGPWTVIVESTGSPRDGHQAATVHLLDPSGGAGPRLAATLPVFPDAAPGDRLTFAATIQAPPESAYGAYLARIGAAGTVSVRSMTVERPPGGPSTIVETLRRGAADALETVLPEPEAGLAAGILIGLRDRVDRDLAAAFTTAGVSHVVAISGWNIAIVAAAVAAAAGRMRRRRRSILTMLAIVAYVVFAGASASVVRAGAMAGVVLLARESGRAGRAAAALAWAAVLLLLADPGLVGDAGFQLSALATAGLIAWATPLTARIERLGRGRLPGWLAENLGVSLAAQAATLPVILVAFGRLALVAPVVNLAVVPLVAPAMAAGLVALTGGLLSQVGAPSIVGTIMAVPGWVLLRLLDAIVLAAASLPFASVTLTPTIATLAAVAFLMVITGSQVRVRHGARGRPGRGARRRADPAGANAASAAPAAGAPASPGRRSAAPAVPPRSPAMRRATLGLAGALVLAGAVVVGRPASLARITVLDVGQGDAILVEGSRGGRLLIDGGPDPARLMVVLDGRIPPWDRRIDAVILSHPHEDHVAGLARLLARYRIGRVYEPGMIGPGPGYAEWLRRLAGPGAPIRLGLAEGDALTVDDISMRVLWPERGHVPLRPPDGGTGINNVSVVLLGSVGRYRFLLAGDVEEDIDPSLLAEGLPRLDLLKVAHHGSRTATTQPFVDAVRPRVAIASAGTGNPYGHPAPSTLKRLADAGARVFRTDLDGTVAVTFADAGMEVVASGGRAAASGARGGSRHQPRRRPDGPSRGLPMRGPDHWARPRARAGTSAGRTAGRAPGRVADRRLPSGR